jgi:hypothetical protein
MDAYVGTQVPWMSIVLHLSCECIGMGGHSLLDLTWCASSPPLTVDQDPLHQELWVHHLTQPGTSCQCLEEAGVILQGATRW